MHLELLASPAVYPLLFGLTLLDGSLPIVPSESAVIAAASFAASGRPALLLVVLIAAAGAFVGDHVAYGLGRLLLAPRGRGSNRLGHPAARGQLGNGTPPSNGTRRGRLGSERLARWLGGLAERASDGLGRRAGVVILTGRFIPCGRLAVTVACGAARYPLRRFAPWTALATTAWATYTALIGYVGGIAFAETPWLGMVAGLVLGLVISIALSAATRRRRQSLALLNAD